MGTTSRREHLQCPVKTELSHSQPAAWMAAAANTGHSAFDIGKDGLTCETGRSQSIARPQNVSCSADIGRGNAVEDRS